MGDNADNILSSFGLSEEDKAKIQHGGREVRSTFRKEAQRNI